MDPITHAVIGMAISKVSGNGVDLTNPVCTAIIAGSVFPDIDILLQKWGDYVYLKNHRGATHSIIGLFASAALIAVVIGGIYPGSSVQSIFLWSLAGCLSHSLFDIFNSYGAKVLWPFIKKKFSLSLLIIFDPVFIGTLIGYLFSRGVLQYVFIGAFALYLVSRACMRLGVMHGLKKRFGMSLKNISLLPSMTGIFRWHFVLSTAKYNIIGEKNIFKRGIKITHRLDKMQDEDINRVLLSKPGKFFTEFTPLFHVSCEKADRTRKYIFTDMRYCVGNNFLHHAVMEVDENNMMVNASFNPYSMNRSSSIPM